MPQGQGDALLHAQKNVLEMIVGGRPLADVLDALCRIVESESVDARAAILRVDDDGVRLPSAAAPSLPDSYTTALDGIAIAADVGTCCATAALNRVTVTPDIASDPGWRALAHLPLELGLKAAWSMPIVAANGRVLGTFGSYFTTRREPTSRERNLVEVLARTAALAIERRESDAALEASSRRHRFLAELGSAAQRLVDPLDVMRLSANALADYLRVDRCAYAEVEDERIFVVHGEARRGDARSILGRWQIAAFGEDCARAMRDGLPWIVRDMAADPRLTASDREAYAATRIVAVVCVPLHKAGVLTAALAVHHSAARDWTPAEAEIVSIVAARCWEALERMRITRTLQDSEARHRAMIEATPEAVTLTTRNGTILQINPAGLGMVQTRPPAELQGENFYAFVAPIDVARFRAFNERVCDGEGGQIQYEVIGRRGVRRTLVTTGVPLPLPSGGHAHLGLTRDISARVAASRALEESRARLDYAVRLSGIGFWYCDLPFDELIWDTSVKQHFFFAPDDRITIDDFYARLHPDDREPTRRSIDESIGERRPYDIVYRAIDPRSGEVHWLHALGGAAYGADGAPTRFDGVTVDVTEQRLDRERLAALNEQLREQDRRKDEFLATLAHELRNPLAPIRTGVEILRSGRATAEQSLRVHEMMDRQLGHLVRMLDDLLDISRVTLGKVSLRREPLDFRSVLHSALETARPLIDAAGHQLSVRVGPGPFPLDGDATRLAQVIANLLNNAARYTPPSGHIELSADSEDGLLIVLIADDGQGIPRDMLTRVFDLFTQLRPGETPSQGGLGLGLTLVRRLIEMHAGTVHAASDGPGSGSTFTVRLPLALAPAPAVAP